MTIKEHLKLNGKELDIKYPISLFDNNGNRIYYEGSNGYWFKYEYDKDGNRTYFEASDGYWYKKEFDNNGFAYAKNRNNKITFKNGQGITFYRSCKKDNILRGLDTDLVNIYYDEY